VATAPPAPAFFTDVHGAEPVRAELFGLDRLEAHARQLAARTRVAPVTPGRPLLRRFLKNRRALLLAHHEISTAYRRGETFGADADWLLDNFHIVSEALHEIRIDLPGGYYRLLPKVNGGPLDGLPRVYAVGLELVAHCDSCLDEGQITRFVDAFQSITPLTIGELWAIPIMLRLVVVDNLRRLAAQIVRARADREKARLWAGRCLTALCGGRGAAAPPFRDGRPVWSDSFIVQLLDCMREHDVASGAEWLEQHLGACGLTTHAVLRRERQRQAANQVSIGNCVTTLRLLSALDWPAFFERTSRVEAVLRQDPAGVYARQDFPTRDRYRREVERLSRGSGWDEIDAAQQAVALAARRGAPSSPHSPRGRGVGGEGAAPRNHVGYYLIDRGRPELERLLRYRPKLGDAVQALVLAHPQLVYFGGIAVVTALALGAVASYAAWQAAGPGGVALAGLAVLLALAPASDIAVSLVGHWVRALLAPRVLPKMHFKEGIPADCAAFVVMPTLLARPEHATSLLERLEVHYLSNPDPRLRFALLTDFADAPAERMPEDDSIVRAALDGVRALNARYADGGPDRFYVFHRRRLWNPVQGCWMGWERKRGKLSEFNRLLRGARDTSYAVMSGDLGRLPRVRYVVTLDADTQLPHDAARRLIATLAHPLNRPRFDTAAGRVVDGYGVLQPRVSLTLTGVRKSRFARVFGGSAGLDPYTTAVSDVYQDLFGVGSYTGKGAYDVDAFEASAGNALPENHILSHDLIEGNFARCGLVTDIEFLDEFPASYLAFARREHRWARGDWQILPWLFPRVPAPPSPLPLSPRGRGEGVRGGTRPNPLPVVERWKILDNLRRTLGPPALVLLLALGWTVLPGSPWVWTAAALIVLFWPLLLQVGSIPGRVVRSIAAGIRRRPVPGGLGNTGVQEALATAFLAEQARLLADAIGRTLARLFVTRRLMLEWETAAAAERRLAGGLPTFLRTMWFAPALAAGLALLLAFVRPGALTAAAPFLVAWLLSPLIAFRVSRPPRVAEHALTDEERRTLRRAARKTWAFFERFVGERDHWLPPDNYQEAPREAVAHRTSPTNIGLYLASCLAAHDFGYVSLPALLDRLGKTFAALDRLERSHGHFYNWYDTRTLKPLPPEFLSTVDSGNLLGCLIALKQGLQEKAAEPIPGPAARDGLRDALELAAEALRSLEPPARPRGGVQGLDGCVQEIRGLLAEAPADLPEWDEWLRKLEEAARTLTERTAKFAQEIEETPEELRRWVGLFAAQVGDRRAELAAVAPWLPLLREMPAEPADGPAGGNGVPRDDARWRELRAVLSRPVSLAALRDRGKALRTDLTTLARSWRDGEGRRLLDRGAEAVGDSAAADLDEARRALASRAQAFAAAMDFKLLYSDDRCLFSVGYNLSQGRLEAAHYDLLASEACLTSFLAVARGDVPKKHWFQLGRPLTRTAGAITLLSWGGTMFEYLMPRLLLPGVPETLLDHSRKGAVARQMEYGRHMGVPWGVSESAFNVMDAALNYQYQAFGVPGLGLKRGLARDLVVAPYAAALAAMIEAKKAVADLRRLAAEGADAAYGFYEAIDYTRDRLPPGQRRALVKCYMAHHQGMTLVALANCLLRDPMPRRFHAEPMVRAAELLLQERMAPDPTLVQPHSDEATLPPASQESQHPMSRRITTPHTAHPRTHLLSSGHYHVMVTNAGGGRSAWHGLDVSRWREDRTRDCWGQFCYIRDVQSGVVWSTAHQPVCREADEYEVVYSTDKAEFRRLDGSIETRMEVTVSPESHAEVRRIKLTNHDSRPHELELTSYVEVVMSSHAADVAHPAFGKLFLETEAALDGAVLLCRRRPRAAEQRPVWGVHILALEGAPHPTAPPAGGAQGARGIEFETDRVRFLGRGRTTADPAAMDAGATLSGTTGPVLDPVFAIRCRVRVEADTSVQLAFTTAAADTREEALALADQFHDFHNVTRAFELAWAHSQVELRHLHLSDEEAHLFQRLASHVLYAGPPLRAAPEVLRANTQGQPGLWRYGISGDNPIVLVRVSEGGQLALVRHMLAAHNYWRAKGLESDLVILNEDPSGYFEEVQEQLQALVRASDERGLVDKPAGVFVRKGTHLSQEDRVLLLSAARCVLAGDRGSLAAQMDRLERAAAPARPGVAPRRRGGPRADLASDAPAAGPPDLLFDNGLGGFTPDGREYVIRLESTGRGREGAGPAPPAPWSNVVANASFGFLATERGGGYTWAGNSQTNRLTPWSNDPASDPPGEIVYLRDDATGDVWTPTALAPGGPDAYRVHHGQGYTLFTHSGRGLRQELLVFTAASDPVKLIRLRVLNSGRQARRLSAAFYAEWVLGAVRDQAPMNVLTDVDEETGALLARNCFNADFPCHVAFADVDARPRSLTGDRTEFLGRNGSIAVPAALEAQQGAGQGATAALSGAAGPGLDPCAAVLTSFELPPGGEKEIVFILGQAADVGEARRLVREYRAPGRAKAAFEEARGRWDAVLGAVRVRTPDPAVDLMLNRWLLYQVLSCRYWGRTAFYQSSGAYGFRDQLQDALALLHAAPQETRAHLLLCATRQFEEGDVQHWWHPPRGAGVRTRCSDDFLWLPFAAALYADTTGDRAVLDERVPFLAAPVLKPGQEEDYRIPDVSQQAATLYEHCARAVDRGLTAGPHGLPLIGTCDWNDGMNRVGSGGRGESVWNGWFLLTVLPAFSELAESRGEAERAARWRGHAEKLRAALDEHAWDGRWFLRAFFDDGTPLGSAKNDECKIDSLAQSWAVISGAADEARLKEAMASAEEMLVKRQEGVILLFTPPFDKTALNPGYVKGYVPGIRENGGQYTHGATWLVLAAALLGRRDRAAAWFGLLNPIRHGDSPERVRLYKTEPYVLAGDVYGEPPHAGRGGWTWYTGSASWLYRIGLEAILGLHVRGDRLTVAPCVPDEWPGYEITYRYKSATYQIAVERGGAPGVWLDGSAVEGGEVRLADDGRTHAVRVVLGE
jgi:cyclic beta-1,2-glucan synthetase